MGFFGLINCPFLEQIQYQIIHVSFSSYRQNAIRSLSLLLICEVNDLPLDVKYDRGDTVGYEKLKQKTKKKLKSYYKSRIMSR